MIGQAYRADAVEQAEAWREGLASLRWHEVLAFQAMLEQYVATADTPGLRDAAVLVNGEASDSGFRNFRLGLVASGKRAYDAAIQDPDSLADFLNGEPLDGFGLDKLAIRAYEERTGGSDFFAKLATRHPEITQLTTKPITSPRNQDNVKQSLPRLWNMYQSIEEGYS